MYHDLPATLDGTIELAIWVDLRFQTRRWERRRRAHPHREDSPVDNADHPGQEAMQVGRTSLSPEERLRRRRANLCLYCGGAGHFISICPVKARTHP